MSEEDWRSAERRRRRGREGGTGDGGDGRGRRMETPDIAEGGFAARGRDSGGRRFDGGADSGSAGVSTVRAADSVVNYGPGPRPWVRCGKMTKTPKNCVTALGSAYKYPRV